MQARSQTMNTVTAMASIVSAYTYIRLYTHITLCYTGWSKSLCAPDDYIPHIIDDLKMAITEYIRNVDCATLNTVFENIVRRGNKCLETGGVHFEHYL